MNCNSGWCGCILHKIAKVLVIVGGLNWGLYGVGMLLTTNLNLVNMIFGSMPTVESVVYILVGISAIVGIFGCPCKTCKESCEHCVAESTPAQ